MGDRRRSRRIARGCGAKDIPRQHARQNAHYRLHDRDKRIYGKAPQHTAEEIGADAAERAPDRSEDDGRQDYRQVFKADPDRIAMLIAANFPSTMDSAARTAAKTGTRRFFDFFIKNSLRRCPSTQARRDSPEYAKRDANRVPQAKSFSSDRQLPVRRALHAPGSTLLYYFVPQYCSTAAVLCQ